MADANSSLRHLVAAERSLVDAAEVIEGLAGDAAADRRVVRALTALARSVQALSGLVGEQYGLESPDSRIAATNAVYATLAAAQDDEDRGFHEAMRERRRRGESG